MGNESQSIKSIDDAIELLKIELNENLTERRFEFDLDASKNLRYGGILAGRYHNVQGCEFFKDGQHYGTLVVDIDPDWQMLNSANYLSAPTIETGYPMMLGINIVQPRTNENPDVSFRRTDSHKVPFLGVSPEGEKTNSGLAVIFMPRYKD